MEQTKEFTIYGGSMIAMDLEESPTDIEVINIAGDFDFADYDLAPHFGRHKKLQEFRVNEKAADRFFARQGCLYLKLSEDLISRGNIEEVSGDDLHKYKSGCVLVCCPQNNPIKDIELPLDCVSITGSAFYGCSLNSLTLPDSLECGALACFSGLNLRILRVPEKFVDMDIDHNDVNTDVVILSNKNTKCSEEVERFWRMAINEETWENGDTEWWREKAGGAYRLSVDTHTIDFPEF